MVAAESGDHFEAVFTDLGSVSMSFS